MSGKLPLAALLEVISVSKTDDDLPENENPLTPEELRRLRRIIQSDDRARWLWASARTWAVWITAIIVGIATIKGFILDLLSGRPHP